MYIPALDKVNKALNFEGAGCRLEGSCDLYTIKQTGDNKKTTNAIEKALESEYNSLLHFAASLPESQAKDGALAYELSRTSPFGPLSLKANRRRFACLVLAMNGTHQDYDFSQSLKPSDFVREYDWSDVVETIDRDIGSAQPSTSFPERPSRWLSSVSRSGPMAPTPNSQWNGGMWRAIDEQINIKACQIYSLPSANSFFAEEEAAAWAHHYFFVNVKQKRVCYLYIRAVSLTSIYDVVPRTPFSEDSNHTCDTTWGFGPHKIIERESSWDEDDLDEIQHPRIHATYQSKSFHKHSHASSSRDVSEEQMTSRSRSRSPTNSRSVGKRAPRQRTIISRRNITST